MIKNKKKNSKTKKKWTERNVNEIEMELFNSTGTGINETLKCCRGRMKRKT